MANKTLKKKVAVKPVKSTFAAPVVDSARDLLFAGLGAFSVAQKESEKLIGKGSKLFDKLVSEGARMERKSLGLAETVVDDIKHDVEARIEDVRKQAIENWDSLGNVFDERVSGTLERLGIPTTRDLSKLSEHVQKMTQKAATNWKSFEGVFEKRVSDALAKLRVPGIDDLNKLAASMQKVSREAAQNLGKLEASTADEIKKLNTGMQDVSRQASGNWNKLESLVEARISEVLGGLNIPSTDDTSRLAAELKKLSIQVADLEKRLKANAKAAAAKPVARKTVAVKAETRMTVAETKKAAEVISKMKEAIKPEVNS